MGKNSVGAMLKKLVGPRPRKPPRRLGDSDEDEGGDRGRDGGLPPRGRGGGQPPRGRGRASRATTVEADDEDEDDARGRVPPRARGRGRASRTRPLSEVSTSRLTTPSASYFSEVIAIMPIP